NTGNAQGGGVFVDSGSATFQDDTLVANATLLSALVGLGGPASGTGTAGAAGVLGSFTGGGYFSAGNAGSAGNVTANTVGNTILALNGAATAPDAFGAFMSLGANLLSSASGATGFVGAGDRTTV